MELRSPSAPFDDLDLDRPEDEEEWERRLMALAASRIAAERVRLERLGIIDENGDLRSTALPSWFNIDDPCAQTLGS